MGFRVQSLPNIYKPHRFECGPMVRNLVKLQSIEMISVQLDSNPLKSQQQATSYPRKFHSLPPPPPPPKHGLGFLGAHKTGPSDMKCNFPKPSTLNPNSMYPGLGSPIDPKVVCRREDANLLPSGAQRPGFRNQAPQLVRELRS